MQYITFLIIIISKKRKYVANLNDEINIFLLLNGLNVLIKC